MRLIIEAEPEEMILAVRAGLALHAQPDRSDMIVAFGEPPTKDFFARRNRASISVRQVS